MDYRCSAVIVAAGSGRRMGSDLPKQFIKLNSIPIIVHTLHKFDYIENIEDIFVVVNDEYMDYMRENILDIYDFKKKINLVEGAQTRQGSVYNGLRAIDDDTDIVIVHDGVRPLINIGLICKSIEKAREDGAVVVGVPVKDTIKKIGRDGYISKTLNRDTLWAVQTPQTFEYDLILDAHRKAVEDGFVGTDDSMLVERLGTSVYMLEGSYDNIKITTEEDLYIAKSLLDDMEESI